MPNIISAHSNSLTLRVPHVYKLFFKMTWGKKALFFLQFFWTVHHVTAIHRHDIYPYGMFYGDVTLQEGDDETSEVITLTKPMYFYEASFANLYVSRLHQASDNAFVVIIVLPKNIGYLFWIKLNV